MGNHTHACQASHSVTYFQNSTHTSADNVPLNRDSPALWKSVWGVEAISHGSISNGNTIHLCVHTPVRKQILGEAGGRPKAVAEQTTTNGNFALLICTLFRNVYGPPRTPEFGINHCARIGVDPTARVRYSRMTALHHREVHVIEPTSARQLDLTRITSLPLTASIAPRRQIYGGGILWPTTS